jgi:glycosyltransferase involved in cell wall biosynthesis
LSAEVTNERCEKSRLSVIMPSHNGDRWVNETLQSVVDQRDDSIEVVVDPSDAGNTLEIVDRFAGRPGIRALAARLAGAS